jgi:uncharacterized protein with GYD domain
LPDWEATHDLEGEMPKYLIIASYTAEGAAGLLQEGGSGRVDAVTSMVKNMGGSIDSFNFGFGDGDAYVIADVPDASDAAAIALAVGASGRASTRTISLLTPAQVDEAVKKAPGYRAPGA